MVTQPSPSSNLKPVKLEKEFNDEEELSPPPCADAAESDRGNAGRRWEQKQTSSASRSNIWWQSFGVSHLCSFFRELNRIKNIHYNAGDVKELINSCHHLPPDEGYREARRLTKKKFGDEYRSASAYESKEMNWPSMKPEDGTALSRFSIYLVSCRNAMSGSQYSSKFDQPDNIQRLVLKLPYSMRERWRRLVDDIMELQKRPVKFDDVITFIDREVRTATNPVFGKI